MFSLFGCKHPFAELVVEKDATVAPLADDNDYEVITYHFMCLRCYKPVQKKYGRYCGEDSDDVAFVPVEYN